MAKLKKGESTKIRIIKAATELIFDQGLNNVTYGQIANKVGLTHPAVYKHFATLEDLVCEACEHWIAEAKEYIGLRELEVEKAEVQLKYYIEKNLRYSYANQKKDALLLGLYYHAIHSPRLMKFYTEMKEGALHRMEVFISRGNYERSWKVQNPQEAALSLHGYIVGEIIKTIIDPRDEKIEKRITRVTAQAFAMLKASPYKK